jgi:SAM-dependent methyltransferase
MGSITQNPRDIQTFDRWSGRYERSLGQFFLFDPVHRAVLDFLPAGLAPRAILDLGCGTGRLLRKAALRWPGARLVGIDPAEGMIAQARQRTPGAAFHLSTAETLSLPESSFDLALSTVSFHHWFDQALALRQVAKVLRPGGYFVLADPVVPLGLNRLFQHGRPASFGRRRQLFEQAGLKVVAERRLMFGVLITLGQK